MTVSSDGLRRVGSRSPMTTLMLILLLSTVGPFVILLLERWLKRIAARRIPGDLILRRSVWGRLVFAWFTVVAVLLGPGFIALGVAGALGLIGSESMAWLIPIAIGVLWCWQWWRIARQRAGGRPVAPLPEGPAVRTAPSRSDALRP